MIRIASITRVKSGKLSDYKKLHDEIWPEVVAASSRYNTRNFSIFQYGEYLVNYSEYIGEDYEADMRKKAADPAILRWKEATGALLTPVNETSSSIQLSEIFHCDFRGENE